MAELPLSMHAGLLRFREPLHARRQGALVNGAAHRRALRELTAKHRVPPPRLGSQALAAFRACDWPGNLRELRDAVERLSLLRPRKPANRRQLLAAAVSLEGGNHSAAARRLRAGLRTVQRRLSARA